MYEQYLLLLIKKKKTLVYLSFDLDIFFSFNELESFKDKLFLDPQTSK